MKCPHCDQEIPGVACPHCGETMPNEAKYCMLCGCLLEALPAGDTEEGDEFDFENRILCPDGTCTGIIVDGKCTVCGKPYKEK